MNLKDYKVIKVSSVHVYSDVRFDLNVDVNNLKICNTVKDENIIIHLNDKYYLVEDASLLFANDIYKKDDTIIRATFKYISTVNMPLISIDLDYLKNITKNIKRQLSIDKLMNI